MSNYKLTNQEDTHYQKLKKDLIRYGQEIVTIRTSSYSGRGRPRKSDFVRIPRNQIADFMALERLRNGFQVHYIREGNSVIVYK